MIEKLSDTELLKATLTAVKKEKSYTMIVLDHLREVEKRKLYGDLGISSLFKYCTKTLGYSDAEASYRVSALRLVSSSRVAKEKVASGELSLTHAAKLNTFFAKDKAITPKKRDDIIKRSVGKSTRQMEKMLRPQVSSKKIFLSFPLQKKIEKLKVLYGDISEVELYEILLDEKIAQVKREKPKRASPGSKNIRHITRETKEFIQKRSGGRCEYISSITGERCDARRNLEWDHIRAVALGGRSNRDNIRHVCRGHNLRAAIKSMGVAKMEPYLLGRHCGSVANE